MGASHKGAGDRLHPNYVNAVSAYVRMVHALETGASLAAYNLQIVKWPVNHSEISSFRVCNELVNTTGLSCLGQQQACGRPIYSLVHGRTQRETAVGHGRSMHAQRSSPNRSSGVNAIGTTGRHQQHSVRRLLAKELHKANTRQCPGVG